MNKMDIRYDALLKKLTSKEFWQFPTDHICYYCETEQSGHVVKTTKCPNPGCRRQSLVWKNVFALDILKAIYNDFQIDQSKRLEQKIERREMYKQYLLKYGIKINPDRSFFLNSCVASLQPLEGNAVRGATKVLTKSGFQSQFSVLPYSCPARQSSSQDKEG